MREANTNDSQEQICAFIDEQQFHCVFQPIVDFRTQKVFAHEAFLRTSATSFYGPRMLFDQAAKANRVGELGRIARVMAAEWSVTRSLFLNIHSQELEDRWLVQPDDPVFLPGKPIYLELSDAAVFIKSQKAIDVLAEIRSKGVRLAFDDFGGNRTDLTQILALDPDMIKLSRNLASGLALNTRKFYFVRALVEFCHSMGTKVIGQGIESTQELDAFYDTGADYGQGFIFGEPSNPPPEPSWPSTAELDVTRSVPVPATC